MERGGRLAGERGAGGLFLRALRRYTDEEGRWRARDVLYRVIPGAHAADSLLSFHYEEADLGGPGDLKVPLVVNSPSWIVLDDGRIAWTSLDAERVRVHRSDGTPERVVGRDAWTLPAASDADHAAMVELLGQKMEISGAAGTR